MKETQEELEFDLGLQIGKTFLDVPQHLDIQLGTNRAPGPGIVRNSQFIVEPQRCITITYVRHVVTEPKKTQLSLSKCLL